MRAAILEGVRDLRLMDLPDPTPGPGELVIRMKAAGICGTDIHYWEGRAGATSGAVRILGHDFGGVVEAVGSGVTNFTVGDRVLVDPARYCGQCAYCQRGQFNLCDSHTYMGMQSDGCFRELVPAPAAFTFKLPDNVSFEEASVLEPAAVALHVLFRVERDDPLYRADKLLVCVGCGPIGLELIQIAKLQGYEIIACDVVPSRLGLARDFGADHLVNAADERAAESVRQFTGDRKSLVVDASGSRTSGPFSIDAATRGSTVVLVGGSPGTTGFQPILAKELTVRGSRGGRSMYREALQLLHEGKLSVKPLLTHRYRLDEIQQAMEHVTGNPQEVIRVVLEP